MVLHRRSNVLEAPSLPELPLDAWRPTKETLQLYVQVAGKIRLGFAPPEPEWAHVTLFVTPRGLTTGPMPYRDRTFAIDFDFVSHELIVQSSDGTSRSLGLRPRPVADFYNDVFALLEELNIIADINPIPQEVANPISFEKDTVHASYDAEQVGRFWQILRFSDVVLKKHRAPFRGRHTPVHFFWGGFDLAYARYSGRPAPPPPGVSAMMKASMDAEEIYSGFWLGDDRFPEPAYASYIYPKPDGVESAKILPEAAFWNNDVGLYVLKYDDVRRSRDPVSSILDFLSSTYDACASLARWDPSLAAK